MRKVKLVLGLGIVLAVVGGTFLAAFGVLYVKPYMLIRTMLEATCATAGQHVQEEAHCTCALDGGPSCLSRYPCLKVFVNVTTGSGSVFRNLTLYDSHDTFVLQSDKLQCSYHKCNRDPEKNMEAVKTFSETFGEPGSTFICYLEPSDTSYAIVKVVTKTTIIHCMLWPSLALVVGFIILLVYLNDPSQAQHHFNSLERPWLRQQARYECINNPTGEANAGAVTNTSGSTGTARDQPRPESSRSSQHLSHQSSSPVAQLI